MPDTAHDRTRAWGEGEVVAVLGARVGGAALDRRIEHAARVCASSISRGWVVACGGRRWKGEIEADAIARGLERRGVAPDRIVCDRVSLTTVENLREVRGLLASRGRAPTSLRIVTCDWHLARALRIACALGLRAEGDACTTPPISSARRLGRGLRERATWQLDRAAIAFAQPGDA